MITFEQLLKQARYTKIHHENADMCRCMIYDLFKIIEQQNAEIQGLKFGLQNAQEAIELLKKTK